MMPDYNYDVEKRKSDAFRQELLDAATKETATAPGGSAEARGSAKEPRDERKWLVVVCRSHEWDRMKQFLTAPAYDGITAFSIWTGDGGGPSEYEIARLVERYSPNDESSDAGKEPS